MGEQPRGTLDVLVVGAGPTGLFMASELARHGISCRIIDKLPSATALSKALVLHPRTLEIFEQLGMISEVLTNGRKVSGVNFYARRHHLAHLSLSEIDSPYPFMLDLPQRETERILGGHLASCGLRVEWQVELREFTQDKRGVQARLHHPDGSEETLTTSWLVGCDGAHSTVRHTLNLPFTGAAYPEAWALAEVKVQWSLPEGEMQLFMHEDGLLAALPMRDGKHRLFVETVMEGDDEKTLDPTLEEIQHYLNKFGPEGSTISDPGWITAFRTHLRQVEHLRQGRVFLVGDAAHIHSPAGGQGMNTGLQDAYNLAWKLALVHKGFSHLSLLDTYEAERHPVAKDVMQTTDRILKIATLRNPALQYVRNRLFPLLMGQQRIQQRVRNQISQVSMGYRKSPIVAEYSARKGAQGAPNGPRAGDRAPGADSLVLIDGTRTRLFDLLRSTKHVLLLFPEGGSNPESWHRLEALAESLGAEYGDHIKTYFVAHADRALKESNLHATVLLDLALVLQRRYGAATECLYLIRPDGYIGFRSFPVDPARLRDYLAQIFSRATALPEA